MRISNQKITKGNEKMKKIFIFLLIAVLCIGNTVLASADNEITVMVNATKVAFDQMPVIENGRTLVPMRAIFEALNAEVTWDEATQTASAHKMTAFKEDIIVKIQIGSASMSVYRSETSETTTLELEVPAKIIGGRTMVPVRAISESLDCDVQWIAKSSTVVITPYEMDERVLPCFDSETGVLNSIVVFDMRDRVIKDIIYSSDTGAFECMMRYDYNGDETMVTTTYADGSTDTMEY